MNRPVVLLVAVVASLAASCTSAERFVRGETSRSRSEQAPRQRKAQLLPNLDGSTIFDPQKTSVDGMAKTGPPLLAPSAIISTFDRFFELGLIVDTEDAMEVEDEASGIASGLISAYNTLIDAQDDNAFNISMIQAAVVSVELSPTDDDVSERRRLRENGSERTLQNNAPTPAPTAPRRRSRATASLTSRGICVGCPPAQRFTTSTGMTQMLRRLQEQIMPSPAQLVGGLSESLSDIPVILEVLSIVEFNEAPTDAPTSAPTTSSPTISPTSSTKSPTEPPTPKKSKKSKSKKSD